MTNKIEKILNHLSQKEKLKIKEILKKIKLHDFTGLDIKKLKGRDSIFRIGKGKLRIIFKNTEDKTTILFIQRRNDNTYN